MQCKDIPDAPILAFLALSPQWGTWFWTERGEDPTRPDYEFKPENSVRRVMPDGIPGKLCRAKMAQLIRRDLVDGCSCGCRGDYTITQRCMQFLANLP